MRKFQSLISTFAAAASLALAGCGVPANTVAKDSAVQSPSPTAAPAQAATARPTAPQPTLEELNPPPSPKDEKAWAEIEQLISEQKLEAAYEKAKAVREAAQAAGNEEEWTRALIAEVQLRTGLHGYETSVRLLKETPWPKGALWRIALQLYYAGALTNYAQIYSWEIGQREKVGSQGPVDLKAWTRDEIYAEAQRAFEEIWQIRQGLGSVPIERLSEYLVPNDYPREVRGTLRDAVSYLRVQLLADTGGWRPQHSNEVWALDLPKLIAGDPAASARLDLADPAVHPLLKIGAILDDLESWHRAANHPEAQLEARLERLRRLRVSLTALEDRETIIADLEKRLPEFRQVPWWSMGMATLAGFVREIEAPDALVRARKIAAEGAERYPESVGGRQCRHLVAAIEAPQFSVSAMLNDGPRRRSVEISHANLPALWMRAYRFDLARHLGQSRNYRQLPERDDLRTAVATRKPDYAWKVELPATPDFRPHRTFATPPIDKLGAYMIVASAREDFGEEKNEVVGAPFIVTNLATITQTQPGRLTAQVLSGETGEPIAGATVVLYEADWNSGHTPVKQLTTGADGSAAFIGAYDSHTHFLAVRKDADLTVDPDYFSVPRDHRPDEGRSVLVYTDRSVYRPAQKILWKVVAYRGRADPARYQTSPKTPLTVALRDSNYQAVATQTVTTNDFGSAAGEFEIPAGRTLGAWSLLASFKEIGDGGSAWVRIEEYKRPTFEVSLAEPKEALRLNREAAFTGEARYYFGLPVSSGQVRWRATRTPVYRWWWWHHEPADEQQVAAGTASLGEDGKFTVRFTPKADERKAADGVSYSYTVSADVVDEGGETRSASRSFRLGFVSVEAQIRADQAFFTAGAPAALKVTRTDLNGASRAGKASWRLFALAQPKETLAPGDLPLPKRPEDQGYSTPGDSMRSRAAPQYAPEAELRGWADAGAQGSGALEHGANGEATLKLPGLAPGAYRLRYQTTDDFGASFETSHDFVVADRQLPLALPAVLLARQSTARAGEKLSVLAHSGIPNQPMLLELFQAGKRLSEQRLRAGSSPSLVEIPVGPELRGGFVVRLSAVRDWQAITLEQSIFVPWDDRQLKVEFATFRDRLVPGAEESWRVTVKGPAGSRPEAGAAELLAYMYDRSLDLFAPHSPFDPLGLYPSGNYASGTSSNLQQVPLQWVLGRDLVRLPGYQSLQGDALKEHSPYGIGGPGRRYGGGYRNGVMRRKSMALDEGFAEAAPAPSAAAPGGLMAEGMAGAKSAETVSARAPAAEPDSGATVQAPAPQVRANFAETAFWKPQLRLDADGAATIEFKVPDSVTSWKVWVHALTRDLKAGSLSTEARSVKELMVRPYLPRFVREGDEATLKVVVNNASDRQLSGNVELEILDPESQQSLRERYGLQAAAATAAFSAPSGGSANVSFPIRVPGGVGQVAFKVVARAGDTSDGELRPLPVLPSRVRLAQSRFVTLKDKDERQLRFEDLARGGDPTLVNESLVVTLDAQLFYSVLSALPYLQRYPYECTEQTLNRFVSTGIVSSVYDRFPAVAAMAKELSRRQTPLETFDAADPNRKIALEETPWLVEAKGGKATDDLVNTLDPRVAAAERASALAKLRKAQLSSGAFPWWPGGPPSPYMTLYLVYGLSKAVEFGVEVPRDMVQRAWAYLAEHYRADYSRKLSTQDQNWEFITFLNYAASCYPDDSWTGGALTAEERKAMLDYSFAHWKQHSPYLKGQLALTLKRADRAKDAKLVFDSVMDSAKTTQDEGTFWSPEDRAWLWYNDTIETHAFALRTLAELDPKDARRGGLVHWLMLNKKLNHWKSTRATAEVIYALVHYLSGENQLGVQERASVTIGPRTERFVFEPQKYTGKKNQIVVPGDQIDPKTMSTVTVAKETPGLMFASATWNFSTETPPAEARGDLLKVTRTYFERVNEGGGFVLRPLAEGASLSPGDEVEVHLSLQARHPCEYVHLRDPRAAGLEPVSSASSFKWDLGLGYYEEIRDSSTNFFFEQLPQGEYTFKYRLRAATAGTFKTGPATVQSMYAPEFVAYSTGATIKVLTDGK